MIKLIIFDLDGVLVDARELHYEALNQALRYEGSQFVINKDEHLSTYDGLPTNKKLKMLTENKGLPENSYQRVWENKQKETINIISNKMTYDERIRNILKLLKDQDYKVAVASNSIRETVKMMLLRKGMLEYIDFYYSNQDVKRPKPATDMYLKCMIKAEVNPNETLILEDSHFGRKSAIASGATLCPIIDSSDLTLEKIERYIKRANKGTELTPKWQGGKMNVLIPMAGAGSRFEQAGYTFPKPLIDVNGKPMIQAVVDNLNIDATYTFIVQKEHYEKYNLEHLLSLLQPNCNIVQVDGVTEGAACTTLLAKEFIDNDEPLVIANSDQFVEWDSNEFMYSMEADNIDGGILTFEATHPKWSFAKLDENGYVVEVAEKKPISNIATVGIYYWRKGSDYVKYAEHMIDQDIRTNGEFYVCPVFNEAILDCKKIKTFKIERMWGLGTPEDLDRFLNDFNSA
jgi:HAD superfamily hydrolase (TIGR01509 family)